MAIAEVIRKYPPSYARPKIIEGLNGVSIGNPVKIHRKTADRPLAIGVKDAFPDLRALDPGVCC